MLSYYFKRQLIRLLEVFQINIHAPSAGKKVGVLGWVMSPLVLWANPRDPATWVWWTLLEFFYLMFYSIKMNF